MGYYLCLYTFRGLRFKSFHGGFDMACCQKNLLDHVPKHIMDKRRMMVDEFMDEKFDGTMMN
jgi:hypothetical protein